MLLRRGGRLAREPGPPLEPLLFKIPVPICPSFSPSLPCVLPTTKLMCVFYMYARVGGRAPTTRKRERAREREQERVGKREGGREGGRERQTTLSCVWSKTAASRDTLPAPTRKLCPPPLAFEHPRVVIPGACVSVDFFREDLSGDWAWGFLGSS